MYPRGLAIIILLWSTAARAQSLPLGEVNADSLLSQSLKDALTKTVGLATINRPYSPASAIGRRGGAGLDAGIEATLLHVADDFVPALEEAGLGSASSVTVIPIPRIVIQKGLGEAASIGISYINFMGYLIYGANLSVAFLEPEEGISIAGRINYSNATVQIVKTTTWSPELLISRKLDFADPYLGVGFASMAGAISVTQAVSAEVEGTTVSQDVTASGTGSARSFYAFTGVQFNARTIGLQLTLEGTYNPNGANGLGLKFGFTF